jgi:hypothetical protein
VCKLERNIFIFRQKGLDIGLALKVYLGNMRGAAVGDVVLVLPRQRKKD